MMLLSLDMSLSAWKKPNHFRRLYVLIQRFPRVTTDMNALESEFLDYQAPSYDEFPTYFDEDDKSLDNDLI